MSNRFTRALRFAVLGGAVIAAVPALAHSYDLGSIHVGHIWAKPAQKGGSTSLYAPFLNGGEAQADLVGVSSPVAEHAYLAGADSESGQPGAEVEAIEIAPAIPYASAPWRGHIVLSGLTQAIAAGDTVPVTLDFGDLGTLEVEAEIETAPSD